MRLTPKHTLICVVGAAALASLAWAGDVWKDKKPADWSEKDMKKFLTNSPWARTVQPAMNAAQMEGAQGPMGANTGGWGGPGGGGGGGMRGGGFGSGAMPISTFAVRWVSAPIMREALKVAESEPLNKAIEKYAKDYYIVSVTMQMAGGSSAGQGGGGGRRAGGGAPGGGGQWGGPGGGQGQSEEGRKRFQEMMTRGVTLKFAGQSVHPERAEMAMATAGMTTLYLFPRSLKLEESDKDYVFESAMGPTVTHAKFSLKEFEQAPEKGL
jgi:hypothetical protein